MMLRLALFFAMILSLTVGQAALAAEDDPPVCTPAMAVKATVGQIAGDQKYWNGRCVTVSAVSRGSVIHDDLDALYRPNKNLDPSERGVALGLDNRALLTRIGRGFRQVTVTGRVHDCEEVRDQVHASFGPDEFVMVMGYCHYHNGAYLWIDAARDRGPVTQPRHLIAGPEAGNLMPVPAVWPWRDKVSTLAQQYLAALRGGDWKAFALLHFEDPATDAPEEVAALKAEVFDAPRSVFTTLRRSDGMPPIQILVDYQYDPEDGYDSTVCFCLTKDCKGRWPIAAFDADNRPDRPYACTRLQETDARPEKDRPTFETTVERAGLPEPGA